jgi:hypothetical protein
MKKIVFTALTAAACSLVLAAGSFAADGDKPERKKDGPRGDRPPGKPGEHLMKLDTDGDKKVSFDEFKVNPRAKDKDEADVKKMFDHLDQDADGFITKEDIVAMMKKRGEGGDRKRPGGKGKGPEGKGPKGDK